MLEDDSMIVCRMVRHGETMLNAKGRIQGSLDASLSEMGRQQAESLREQLTATSFCRVYSSPMKRAHETAQILAVADGAPIIEDQRLVELNFGELEGMAWETYNELRRTNPAMNSRSFRPNQGESLDDLSTRVSDFLLSLRDHSPRLSSVLVVSHGFVIREAAMLCSPANSSLGFLGNCEVCTIGIPRTGKGPFSLVSYRGHQSPHLDYNTPR